MPSSAPAHFVDVPGHGLDGVQTPATREHRETAQEGLLARPEQIVAPPDSVADGALSQWQV
jgi:hypothetical protein